MSITKEPFGVSPSGMAVSVYQLTNASGAYVRVMDLGATILELKVPDKDGKLTDVVLGHDSVEDYLNSTCYFGATIGRNGNRIANASFSLNGKTYRLGTNDGKNNLHSGPAGFDRLLWQVKEISQEENSIIFGRISPAGEQGFPGTMNIQVKMEFSNSNELMIQYLGVTDEDTVMNLTNHSYFNLSGHDSGSVQDQELQILADAITPVADSASIPTGELRPVEGTPMDFRQPKPIGKDIAEDYDQLIYGNGYDHNYVTNDYVPGKCRLIASGYSKETGIAMDVHTDLPGVQFYSANFVEKEPGKQGAVYGKRSAFCLETQYFPDAVNQKQFPSPILKAGTFGETTTVYRFYVK